MMFAKRSAAQSSSFSSDLVAVTSHPGSGEHHLEVGESIDFRAWELYHCWKEQLADRFGGGNSAPSIPRSQRQYDGDNPIDYCEVMVLR